MTAYMSARAQPSPAAACAERLAALLPGGRVLLLPRDLAGAELGAGQCTLALTWEPRPRPQRSALDVLQEVQHEVLSIEEDDDGAVAMRVEGVCRVREGSDRHGAKTTCVVVHVTTDGEPARVVLIPTE